jgi:uncharacterized YccA/Bax inhibitor family protein
MKLTSTSNPVLTSKAFAEPYSGQSMSIDGTVNKSIILFFLLIIAGSLSWKYTLANVEQGLSFLMPAALIGFVIAMVTIFKKEWAPYTAPIYVIAQGVFLGAISSMYNALYEGIVLQAVMLTMGILGFLLFAYKTRIIVVTEKLKAGIMMATFGVMIVYVLSFVLNFFGASVPYLHSGGIIGIGISLVIVIIAALNLLLDFSFIEESAKAGAPKYMEWFAAFGLMLTLVWLYLEILRLLSKMRD